MKLILLLLAIYSLIFYQSYKIEKLKDNFINIRQSLDTKKFYQDNNPGKEYQNAVLKTKSDNTLYNIPAKKQLLSGPLAFY